MTNIDPVMTTQRAEKRLAKALESGPGESSDCSCMENRFNRSSDKDEEGGLFEWRSQAEINNGSVIGEERKTDGYAQTEDKNVKLPVTASHGEVITCIRCRTQQSHFVFKFHPSMVIIGHWSSAASLVYFEDPSPTTPAFSRQWSLSVCNRPWRRSAIQNQFSDPVSIHNILPI